ncbi:MAG TPA: hypothetical protein VFU02_21070 [Polyangiaceae bacterium]|nr:hypothetical protein [Polyangiaceae bacterium]
MTKFTETKSPAHPPTRVRRIAWSVVCACTVFAGFVAYAFLAPTTYQTTATVHLEVPAGLENSLHPIADRRHRLTKAVLGPDSLKQLSQELKLTTPDQRLELAHQLSTGITIATNDGQTFRIVCTNAAALRAQQLCQWLARAARARLPEASMLRNGPEEQARKEKLERLLEFLSQHPELSQAKGQGELPGSDAAGGKAAERPAQTDALLNALTQQRRVVIAELNGLQRIDPRNPDADRLKREADQAHKRLAAIDVALMKRRKGLEATQEEARPELDAKVMASLTDHLNQLAARDSTPLPKAALKASVTEQASLPSSPIVPDRTRLLILGALASLGVAILGLGFAFAARGRPEPSRPSSAYPDPEVLPREPAADPPQVTALVPVTGSAVHRAAYESPPNGVSDGAPAQAPPNYVVSVSAVPAEGVGREHRPQLPPAETASADLPGAGAAGEVLEGHKPVNLTTTQVMEDPAPPRQPEPAAVPRTQVGGFELALPPAQTTAPHEVLTGSEPNRPSHPISARTVVALEANVSGEDEPEESAPQTLLGGTQAPAEPERPPPQAKAYTPPKRNITRRLGSLSWPDQAEVSRTPAQPVSTRYSYVSSRPPPPDGVIDVPAEGDEPPGAAPPPPLPLTRRHPVPAGWNLQPELMPFSTQELATTVSEGWREGCIVVGVTARYDLSRVKASVAASLAFRLGESVPRVLLMEGDFQDPKVHRTVRVEMPIAGGLSQQLQLRLARGTAPDTVWEVMECHTTVDVLAEGFIRSPGGILSQQFEQCLNDLRNCYDLIIIDGPPTSTGSEAQAFADLVDGVVVCTPRDRPDVQGLADGLFRNQRFIVPFPLNV